jgi:hypothetical protein
MNKLTYFKSHLFNGLVVGLQELAKPVEIEKVVVCSRYGVCVSPFNDFFNLRTRMEFQAFGTNLAKTGHSSSTLLAPNLNPLPLVVYLEYLIRQLNTDVNLPRVHSICGKKDKPNTQTQKVLYRLG